MKRYSLAILGASLFASATILTIGNAQEPKIGDLQDSIEVLTRGPLHEAYAQPVDLKAEPGPMVPKEPPPPVPEDPPEQRPEADNAQWIPGYWAWDDQKEQFLWVSGVYRVPPQGRTFVPGYWQHTQDGWRWVNGFWADSNRPDLPYTPEPPATLDQGPAMPAPDDNSTYIPGAWVYRDSRFVWRPGYYAPVRLGYVWNPPCYLWTPNGYLFNDGYWDYPFEDRGLIYAPVYFHRPLWQTAGWRYRPGFVVGYDAFFDSAFVRIGGFGFYFGNFYGANYARHYRPWYHGHGRYDPVFAYHGHQHHRNNPNWVGGVQSTYAARSAGRVAAPPTTFGAQNAKTPRVVTPVNQFTSKNVKLVKATPTQIETQRTLATQTVQAAQNRQKLDAAPISKSDPPRAFRASETKLPTFKTPATTRAGSPGNSPGAKGGTTVVGPGTTTVPRSITPPPSTTTKPATPQPAPKSGGSTIVGPGTTTVPRSVTPPPATTTKPATPQPAPKSGGSTIVGPGTTTVPRSIAPPPSTTTKPVAPQPVAPKPVAPQPVAPKAVAPPAPRINTPPPAPPRTSPPAKRASIEVSPPRAVAPAITAPKASTAPPRIQSTPAPRIQSAPAPRIQSTPARSSPPPRVSAPPVRSSPPARSSPPLRPANTGKRR